MRRKPPEHAAARGQVDARPAFGESAPPGAADLDHVTITVAQWPLRIAAPAQFDAELELIGTIARPAQIGIEAASVHSRFAKEREDVGKATIGGFVIVTSLMVLVTLLPFAVLQRAEIARLRQPSMAGVLESVVGPWGQSSFRSG